MRDLIRRILNEHKYYNYFTVQYVGRLSESGYKKYFLGYKKSFINEIAEKIDPINTLSGEEIKKYKKEITDKMKVKMLQSGSLECRLELDI